MVREELHSNAELDSTRYIPMQPEDFPYRTKADLHIRRLKLQDLDQLKVYHLKNWLTHLDTITVSNILIWAEIHGEAAFMELKKWGFFNSISKLIEMGSKASSFVKRFPSGCKQMFAEINVLCGYMQNDVEETDWSAKFDELVNAGEQHPNSILNHSFYQSAIVNTPKALRTKIITLKEYIDQGIWLTAGSSSIGQIEWSSGQESGHFKARKNMLEFLYTGDELYDMVLKWDGRLKSKAFTKDELSKRRIAVASNIESYLCESYLLYNLGHYYKGWQYITLDETQKQEHVRTCNMSLDLKQGMWALPFDYKAFDHQPTLEEIQTMLSINLSPQIVSRHIIKDWTLCKHKVVSSYNNNYVSMKINDQNVEKRMIGGLPSGVRLTSLIGNQWNCIMTGRAREIVEKLMGGKLQFTIGIRGDDSYIMHTNPAVLYLFRLAYQSINAVGLDAKFGIHPSICEFLRIEVGVDGARGWSNRSIPSITQRKPWNPEPWSLVSGVTHTAGAIRNLERRLSMNMDVLHQINKRKWSKFTGLCQRWLELPTYLGGLGLYPFNGYVPEQRPKYKTEANDFKITNKVVPTSPSWITLSSEDGIVYSRNKLQRVIAGDDIPGLGSALSRSELEVTRRFKTRWKFEPFQYSYRERTPQIMLNISRTPYWPDIKRSPPEDKLNPMEIVSDYNCVPKHLLGGKSLMDLLTDLTPNFAKLVKTYEQKGWHRSDAIRLALDDVPTGDCFDIHPKLTAFVKEQMLYKGIKHIRGRKNIHRFVYNVSTTTQAAINQSAGSRLYLY